MSGLRYLIIPRLTISVKIGYNFHEDGTISGYCIPKIHETFPGIPENIYLYINILFHVIAIGTQITITLFILNTMIKSMNEKGASKATVINFCINYTATIFLASLLFNDSITLKKVIGVTFIVFGTSLIASIKEEDHKKVIKYDIVESDSVKTV
ncbi:UNKNOWN [Stylonychia lemnae]|uniref:Uncharacterized protein n=1 Tax=Stylonychia lemnae TaxID=5949 RepID=A0A078BDU3_STYLE|nr:UNKNOWN [Stylonychia lemnae]|eukprot:CDW91748.1 UNKNOWN [Stylonychia lemnae]